MHYGREKSSPAFGKTIFDEFMTGGSGDYDQVALFFSWNQADFIKYKIWISNQSNHFQNEPSLELDDGWFLELLDTILDDHHTKKSEIDQSLINSMDTIAKYRLGPEKLEKIQAENKEKIERLQSTYINYII